MLQLKRSFQRLTVFPLIVLAGCASTGQKVAEIKDPFLTPASATAEPKPTPTSSTNLKPLPPIQSTNIQRTAERAATFPSAAKLASFEQDANDSPTDNQTNVKVLLDIPHVSSQTAAAKGETAAPPGNVYPIDLANALALGGADNLQVRLARTHLFQAQARHFKAKTLWLPSLRFGVGYNKHDGRLQQTEGNVLEINRNSLFYGGGLGLGGAPLAGGASGPARLMVNLSLADAWFKPLSAYQEVSAYGAAERVATNDSLEKIAVAYHSLVEAHGKLANARAARELSQNMVSLVENFEREGFSSQTEVHRAQADLGRWQRDVIDAQRETVVRSAELARLLRLPPQIQLVPAEQFVLPIELIDPDTDMEALIAQGLASRPEIAQYAALREAASYRVKEEQWRPWIPSVQVGASGGGFGGGTSTNFRNAASRSDVDLLAVWELKNMGLGNVALQRQRRGELHERLLEYEVIRDRIASEIVAAAADVASYRQQMEIARQSITAAGESYQLNEQRIRESEGLPIELLQSISALAEAQNAYTEAVANYNRAQYRLLRAMGNRAGVAGGAEQSVESGKLEANDPSAS